MLLCDSCDNECHTYCQYPVLWAIPEGHWYCPACTEVSARGGGEGRGEERRGEERRGGDEGGEGRGGEREGEGR